MKLVLGLIWTLIQRYQIGSRNQRISTKGILILWSKAMLPQLRLTNLTSDWNDGRALCGLVENLRPGLCPDYLDLDPDNKAENVEIGMHLAETHLGVPSLIELDDFIDPNIDELSMMTYLSYFVSPAKVALLKWVKELLPEFNITNFSTDWSNGIALGTLMHRLFDQLCVDCHTMKPEDGLENLRLVIDEAEYRLGVKKLLTPAEMIDPDVDELSVITFLALFKTATLLPLAGECACSGAGLTKAVVRKTTRFKVDGSRAGDMDGLTVKVQGPSEDIPVTLSPLSPGVFTVSYCCQEIGEHSVVVALNGQHVPGSPYHFNAFDPRKCEVILQPSYAVIDQEAAIVLDSSDAGKGTVQARLRKEDEGAVAIQNNDDGTVTVSVTPYKGSELKLELLYNNELLTHCAVVVPLVDAANEASKGRLRGSGVYNASNLQRSVFTVTGLPPGLLDIDALAISITGIGNEAEVDLSENEDGTYTVEYVPPKAGAYLIHVHCYGVPIPGSPFKLTVQQRPEGSKCVFYPDKNKYKVSGQELVFKVDAKDAGTGRLAAAILSEKHEVFKVPCELTRNGQYVLRFTPNDGKCRYILHVRWSRQPVPGTPHRFRAWPGADASKCIAYGRGLNEGVVNEPCEFHIDAREAGIGSLSVRVHGVKDAFKVKVVHGEPDPRVLTATYNPQEAGEYLISIRWSSVEVPGSSFGVFITDPDAELEAQLREERLRQRSEDRRSRRIKSEEERRLRMEERQRAAEENRRQKIEELKRRSEEKRRMRQQQEEERQASIREMEQFCVSTPRAMPGHYSRDGLQQQYFLARYKHGTLMASGGNPAQYYQHRPISTRHRSSSFHVKRETKKRKKKKKRRTSRGSSGDEEDGIKWQPAEKEPISPDKRPLGHSYSPVQSDTGSKASVLDGSKSSMFGMGFSARNFLTGRRQELDITTERL